jgi:hypothetical protein
LTCDEIFCVHLVVFKRFYYKPGKLGSNKTWILTIVDDHILDSQWNLMPNGLWTNPWIWTPFPSFGKSCPIMLCCLLILVSSWKWQNWWFSYYGICERHFFFSNTNFHENKISKEVMWTFIFGGLNVYTIFLHGWKIPLCQCHHSLKVTRKEEKSFGLN